MPGTALSGIEWARVEIFQLDEYIGLPSTTVRDAWQKRGSVASLQTRWANGERAAAVSSTLALSTAAG